MDWFSRGVHIAAGFALAVVVGAKNGRELAEGTRDTVALCAERTALAYDSCLARVDGAAAVHRDAMFALGERCVLLPGSERLTVARMPRVTP